MRARREVGRRSRGFGRGPAAGIVLAAVFLISSARFSYGQSDPPRRAWGLMAGGLFPMGEFNSKVGTDAIGASVFFAWRLGRTPVYAGVEAAGHIYPRSLFGDDNDTYNTIIQGLAFLRLQPRTRSAAPYLEVLAGLHFLRTATIYYDDYWDEYFTETDFEGIAMAAGIGAGLCMRLGRDAKPTTRFGKPTYLDFKVRYVFGGRADYMKELADGSLYKERSKTNFLTAQLGLSWFF
jgi:hypothetical protein